MKVKTVLDIKKIENTKYAVDHAEFQLGEVLYSNLLEEWVFEADVHNHLSHQELSEIVLILWQFNNTNYYTEM